MITVGGIFFHFLLMRPCVRTLSAEDACYQTQGVLLYSTLYCRLCNQLAGVEALLDVMTPLMVDSWAKLSMAVSSQGIVLFDTIVSLGRSFTAPMTRSEKNRDSILLPCLLQLLSLAHAVAFLYSFLFIIKRNDRIRRTTTIILSPVSSLILSSC